MSDAVVPLNSKEQQQANELGKILLTKLDPKSISDLMAGHTLPSVHTNLSNGELDPPVKSTGPMMNIRIGVVFKEDDRKVEAGHEVIKIDSSWTYNRLVQELCRHFKAVYNGTRRIRSNIETCYPWDNSTEILKIKAVGGVATRYDWDNSSSALDSEVGTILTETNTPSVLALIYERRGHDRLVVTAATRYKS